MSFNNLLELAKVHAQKAVQFDSNNQFEQAIFYYLESSQCLIDAKELNPKLPNLDKIDSRLNQYITRAETLKQLLNSKQSTRPTNSILKSLIQKDLEKCLCILKEALDADSDGNSNEAFDLYTSSVEFFLKIKQRKNEIKTNEEEKLFTSLKNNIENALKRAEDLKNLANPVENFSNISIVPPKIVSSSFTKDEIDVLRHGSFINGRDYVPFFPEIDSKEKFFLQIPFNDKDGKLALSPSQKSNFSKWARPDEIFENPTLMMSISCFSVKQTCISDCSFVASLTVCAQYERKFNKKILSKIIYPQNKSGEPIFNPCGKYMISLNLNGCARKIIIDDYLPVDSYNTLLCSKSTNKGELWVSLLEKAYMKVMGGYDFPGSNSNIDLHALTNWIPERLAIHGNHTEFNQNSDFDRMFDRLHSGDVLITVSTGPMNKDREDRTGLVSSHAYAVLDIRKFRDKKLFQLKNPWSHLRWKGNYSEYDVSNWTNELKTALNYDPKLACNVDNGIFWIDYESLVNFFDVFYLSWSPSLFPYTNCFHRKWSSVEGPIKDRYNLSENPQYVIKIKPNSKLNGAKCSTWLLLTRHITDKSDFAENKEYIALVVYKNDGKRVYYPMEPPPYKEGIRINSPHYLVKLVDDCSDTITYTLVICQYEKNNTIYYTLRAYSTMPFTLNEITEPYNRKYWKRINGKWEGITAGGCSNHRDTYKNNPTYEINVNNSDVYLKIELKGPQQFSVGFDFIYVNTNQTMTTGDLRKGYCVMTLNKLLAGVYRVIPFTFLPKQDGPFILEISSTHDYNIKLI
ncbi:unnamed protein product [Brachionus calyciflorus]|uniref:Calpain catalytic domain-containing protein n=1 Tax=Brachionus calyciflorus TaxID=104777 RepID=A0A813Q374_9BILA|nr:unnamed protein product [Brachionus calyciflorus]